MQIANGHVEIEIGENDRAHHAAVEIGGYELAHAERIDRLEDPAIDALADDLRQHLPLLIVEPLDGFCDFRIAFVRTSKVESDFYEAMDLRVLAHVVLEPGCEDGRGIRVLVIESADILERVANRVL